MKLKLIDKETAVLAKEKGFNWWCEHYYTAESTEPIPGSGNDDWNEFSGISAPPQALLKMWLRGVHKINIVINPSFDCFNIDRICKYHEDIAENEDLDLEGLEWKDFITYEEALEEALQEALNLI